MKNAAVGFRVHSGWSALVVVALEKGEPLVLCRKRIHLVKTFNYSFRQPYHTAAKMALPDGRAFISQVRTEARRMAVQALREVQAELDSADYRLTHCALLLGSARALPGLERILAAHPLIHTADGELFREVVSFAGEKYGLKEFAAREKHLLKQGAEALGTSESELLKQLTELGRPSGSPWSQDEKFAALAAWLALTAKGKALIEAKKRPPA